MSIAKFFTDRFGRVRPLTTKADNDTATDTQQQTVAVQPQQVNLVDVRKEGFKDGVLEIDQAPFESWITHSEELEVVKHKLSVQRNELSRLNTQLHRAETEGERMRVEIAGSAENIRLQEQYLEQSNEKIADNKQERQSICERLESIKPTYSFVPALLFLLAGIALLAADYVVSKEIVAKGMDMGGSEAVMFATAMAMMAFAVKPAVDRIFEKGYKEGNLAAKRRNHWFVGTVGILVLLSLGLLGYFRSDADGIMGSMDVNRTTITQLQSQDQTDAVKEQIGTLTNQNQALQKELQDNPFKKWSFIALAVMFALASAVCLSIAFPSLEAQISRLSLGIKRQMNAKKLNNLTNVHNSILQIISENKSNITKSQATLNELKLPTELIDSIHALQIAIAENIANYHEVNSLALTYEYRDAYLEALSYDVEGRPSIYWKEVAGLSSNPQNYKQELIPPTTASTDNGGVAWYKRLLGGKQQVETAAPQPTYAHQRLRKLIQDRKLN